MNAAIAEWCARFSEGPTKILYLPNGPRELRYCELARYDIIVTKCELADLDNEYVMACLWRLGYEEVTPRGVLLLQMDGWSEAPHPETYLKMSNIGWCRWDTLEGGVGVFHRTQTLAPWVTNENVRHMSPMLTVVSDHV